MKKAVSVIIGSLMLFAQGAALAESDLTTINDDFSGYTPGSILVRGGNYNKVSSPSGRDRLYIEREQDNNYLKSVISGTTAKKQYFAAEGVNLSDGANISFRINPMSGYSEDMGVEVDSYMRTSLIRFTGGKISVYSPSGAKVIGSYKKDTWYNVDIKIKDSLMNVTVGDISTTVTLPTGVLANRSVYFVMNNHGFAMTSGWDDIKIEYYKDEEKSEQKAQPDTMLLELKNLMKGLTAFKDMSPRVFTENGVSLMTESFDVVCKTDENGRLLVPAEYINKAFQRSYSGEYVSLDEVAKDMNKFIYYDKQYNNWILGSANDPFNGDSALQQDMSRRIRYPRPSGDTVVKDMFENTGFGTHPRLLAKADDFERIKGLIETDETVRKWYEYIKKQAETHINKNTDYSKMQIGDWHPNIITSLAFCYRITGDAKYGEELWNYLNTLAQLEDWRYSNTIETAEISAAIAIGYDWCYDYFDDNRKAVIRNAVIEKSLKFADAVYRGDVMNAGKMVTWWPNCDHNWNFVCNGGFLTAALGFCEEDEELMSRIIGAAIKGLEGAMESFGDNGGWDESVSYWKYGTQYLYKGLEVLETATGVDYGYMNIPYIGKTGLFPYYMQTNNGSFNFGDGGSGNINVNELSWAAKKFKDKGYLNARLEMMEKYDQAPTVEDIIFYCPDEYEKESTFPLDEYFGGTESVVLRGDRDDKYSTWVGLHGGLNNVNHGQLDIGTFVLDALGERWFYDLGNDSYSLSGYFDRTIGGMRWLYYRNRAEGANTVVVNPGYGPEQNEVAKGQFIKYVTGVDGAYAVLDMSSASPDTSKHIRGVKLYDNRSKVVLQDEIEFKKSSELYWFGHTLAEIELSEDGKRAILTNGGKKLQAEIISPVGATFTTMPASRLESSPDVKNGDNSSYQKLTIHMENVLKTRIMIAFLPLEGKEFEDELPKNTPIEKWYVSGEEQYQGAVKGITVGDTALDDFDFNRTHYTLGVYSIKDGMPEVKADVAQGFTAKVTQANDIYTPAVVELFDESGRSLKEFYIYFERRGLPLTAHSVSSEPEAENVKENVLDGSYLTRWSSSGDNEWIILDMGEEKTINSVAMSWHNGNQRIAYFDIETSTDLENWSQVYKGESSGKSNSAEFFTFEETKARYVRINCHATNKSTWNSITTVNVYEP